MTSIFWKGDAMKGTSGKILILLGISALVFAFFNFGGSQYLTLDYLKSSQQTFGAFYAENAAMTIAAYMGIYIVVTALSLPGATILTLAGGALFGVVTGTVVVSFASTIGASCAFIVARFLLRDTVQAKFGEKLQVFNKGVENEGAFYLFTLRLIPIFPFFMINLVMGLTPLKLAQFFFVSQLGMLPGTAVYVNAGTQLGQIDSLKGILSLNLIISFALLGILPIVAKKVVGLLKSRKGGSGPSSNGSSGTNHNKAA